MGPASSKIIVVLGPTSTGKTSLAIKLCQEFNGEIVSADSRQVYKFMDIGTGKLPSDPNLKVVKGDGFWDQDGIKIRAYDLALPTANFTVVDYARVAKEETESIIRRGKVPFLVGGTGFYIDVLLGRSPVSNISPDWKFRESLKDISAEELVKKLKLLDPRALESIDKNNPVRLIRALEIAQAEKSSVTKVFKPLSFPTLFIGLTASRNILFRRGDLFVDDLLKRGILQEVEFLIQHGYKNSRPLAGLIYDQFVKFSVGETTLEESLERAKFDTHAYIRRQLTWFNRNTVVTWFNIEKDNLCASVKSHIQSFLDGK